MNKMPGLLIYSLILIYVRAFLHHSSSAKNLGKGLPLICTHSIQLYSKSLYTALNMFSHINENQALQFQGKIC